MKSTHCLAAAALALTAALAGCSDESGTATSSTTTTTTVTSQAPVDESSASPRSQPTVTVTATSTGESTATAPATSEAATSATPEPPASTAPASPAPAASTGTAACGTSTARQARDTNMGKVTPDPGMTWSTKYEQGLAGYDACQDLSYIVLMTDAATGSSPTAIMLFHRGEYLGTASKENFGFTPDIRRLAGSKIQVTYRYLKPGESTAAASGRAVSTFTWDEAQQKVVHAGQFPPQQ